MFKKRSLIGIIVLNMAGLLIGCKKNKEQFIMSSNEDGIICSAKSTFNDTLFYENRFPDTTVYYYAALSKYQNDQLRKLILNLKTEKSMAKFELRPDSGTFIVGLDPVRFYEANYSIPSRNIKQILGLFRDTSFKMKPCKKIKDFWNISSITPPDNTLP